MRNLALNEMNSKGYFADHAVDDLHWRLSNLMKIRTRITRSEREEDLARWWWRLPPKSANTLHKQHPESGGVFILCWEGNGADARGAGDIYGAEVLYGGAACGAGANAAVFNDTDAEVLWLIIGGPEELEFCRAPNPAMDLSLISSDGPDATAERELAGVQCRLKTKSAYRNASDILNRETR